MPNIDEEEEQIHQFNEIVRENEPTKYSVTKVNLQEGRFSNLSQENEPPLDYPDEESQEVYPLKVKQHKRKKTGNFESELAGHSEQILGTIGGEDINFTNNPDQQNNNQINNQSKPNPQAKYPDKSFVNLGDSFSKDLRVEQQSSVESYPYGAVSFSNNNAGYMMTEPS